MSAARRAILVAVTLALVACTPVPPRPAILRELLAATPAGTEVVVERRGRGSSPFDTDEPNWAWSVTSPDNDATLAAYRAWFEQNGVSTTSTQDGGVAADGGRLTVQIGTNAAGEPAVVGVLYDTSALAR